MFAGVSFEDAWQGFSATPSNASNVSNVSNVSNASTGHITNATNVPAKAIPAVDAHAVNGENMKREYGNPENWPTPPLPQEHLMYLEIEKLKMECKEITFQLRLFIALSVFLCFICVANKNAIDRLKHILFIV